jgi:hypothetical protein
MALVLGFPLLYQDVSQLHPMTIFQLHRQTCLLFTQAIDTQAYNAPLPAALTPVVP